MDWTGIAAVLSAIFAFIISLLSLWQTSKHRAEAPTSDDIADIRFELAQVVAKEARCQRRLARLEGEHAALKAQYERHS